MAFTIRQREGDEVHHLELEGSLDAGAVEQLAAAVLECVREGRQSLLLDLSRLAAVDGSGVRALVTAGERLEAAGGRLALAKANQDVAKVFGIAHLDRHLAIYDSRHEAVHWLHQSVRVARVARLASALLRQAMPGVAEQRYKPPDNARLELAARLLGVVDDSAD